jgi:hypothetical protein
VRRAPLALLLLALAGSAPAATALPSALAFSRPEAAGGGVFVLERSGRVRLVAPGGLAPAWSPDGRRLAYVAPTEEGATDLYVADADGRNRARIVHTEAVHEVSSDWSPDGRRLVVESGDSLVVVRANGLIERPITGGREPDWSPRGPEIAFVDDRAGSDDLYLVQPSGRGLRRLTSAPGSEHAPAWSPDGSRLAFVSDETGTPDLYVLHLESQKVLRLTDDPTTESTPAWTPEGRTIAFVSNRTGVDALWGVPAGGGTAVPLSGLSLVDHLRWRPPATLELRPDLNQRPPADLSLLTVRRGGRPRFLLGFASATDNLGEGPVSIVASRASRGVPTMRAGQRIRLVGGGTRTYTDVGFLRYNVSPTHSHWHLMDFQRYELRRAADHSLVMRDRKSGFCLTDRWTNRVAVGLPGQPRRPRFTAYCGRGDTRALAVGQGTSVGYTDLYPSHFHGQNLDVTRVPAGLYVLVHRANPELLLRELRYENNAAALLVRLSWPRGGARPPRIRVLATCSGSERCPVSSS